nr:angiomotin-like [Zootoca vivipara]
MMENIPTTPMENCREELKKKQSCAEDVVETRKALDKVQVACENLKQVEHILQAQLKRQCESLQMQQGMSRPASF